MVATAQRQTAHRIQGLDLLRGVAILGVMLHHSWSDAFPSSGLVGVVIFFTLSGYLITGLLVGDIRRFGKVRYGRFYRNRAIRLIPALLFMLAGYVVVEGVLRWSGDRSDVPATLLSAITYTSNIPGLDRGSSHLSHLWTLANEEQFYLLWPLLLLIGMRFRRLRLVIAAAAAFLTIGLIGAAFVAAPDYGRLYELPVAWTIAMIIGSAAKLGEDRVRALLAGWRGILAVIIGVAVLAGIAMTPDARSTLLTYLLGGPAIGVATVFVIIPLSRVAVVPVWARPLVWLGTISYAAYLWNYPIRWWLIDTGWGNAFAPAAFVLTIVAATVSWYVVEKPMNRWKSRLDARARERTQTTTDATVGERTTDAARE
ncbi:MAG: acyltransferase [Mycetocola sp.]